MPKGWQLIVHAILDSTNAEAKRLAIAGAGVKAGVVVIQAEVQTSGRGRGVRTWYSHSGNLHFSVLLQPNVPITQFALAGFVTSVAVVEGIAETIPALRHRLACKWPNDVLCGMRKLCGILGEWSGDERWVAVGIGINVAWAPEAAIIRYPATSLAAEGVIDAPLEIILSAVCHRLAGWLARWQAEGFAPVRRAWLALAVGVGRKITVHLHQSDFSGVFAGLDHDGALLVERAEGSRQRVLAGDVFFHDYGIATGAGIE
ncbi:Biotin-protein ligase [invertebrate metagenome]|uniref:Biotin-protein ligase n=1 Tax=invertebrate metagenome TaxID=1711999 RepID=A0A484H4F8_9ZZZZ